jgi:single-stranded-DNA-specific exonuclease
MAAGLTVEQDRIEAAMARLGELLARQGAGLGGPADLRLDGLLMPGAATHALVEQIEAAGPFGAAAPAPRFAFADQAVTARRVGETHLRLSFTDGLSPPLDAIAFGAFDTALGPALLTPGAQRFHLAGRLEISHWNGRSKVQLRLEDASRA